ncbi:hypothetical protein BGZ70_002707 [Mortierella alpina]|uniref:Uncharacterized protein n=1 Tax=Mortierella alpina TaxID=64518 RepID=A0A9P6LWZ6_MORAP|nr:hypothetical protein BGZ70_002707 [Mortierella alpina]
MDSLGTTSKASNSPASVRDSALTDPQLQQGLKQLKKGDEYRDRGDFDKAKAKYEKAAKFCPIEAHDRLEILPLCKASMQSSASERSISVSLRARFHHVKEKVVKPVQKHPSSILPRQQSFFLRPSISTQSTQSTVASLDISDSQSTLMSMSTCMTTSTATSQSTMSASSTLASETVVNDLCSMSDVRSLTAAYKTADDGARGILLKKIYDTINEFRLHQVTLDTVQELVVLADIQDRDIFLHIVIEFLHVLKNKTLLSDIALQGLAVILDLFPDDIDMSSLQGSFADILAPLHDRLHNIRTVNNGLQLPQDFPD